MNYNPTLTGIDSAPIVSNVFLLRIGPNQEKSR